MFYRIVIRISDNVHMIIFIFILNKKNDYFKTEELFLLLILFLQYMSVNTV